MSGIYIDKFSSVPIYEQIGAEIRREILLGLLKSGEQISSLRELSASLGINPNTIQRAYSELIHAGIIAAAQCSGYFVTPCAADVIRAEKETELEKLKGMIFEFALAGVEKTAVSAVLDAAFADAGNKQTEVKIKNDNS